MKSIVALLLLLAACTAPAGPQPSGIETPQAWSTAAAGADEVEQHWWQAFGDPALDRLIDAARANNKTLQIAAARVEEVRADRNAAVAGLFPEIAITGTVNRGNQGVVSGNRTLSLRETDIQASWEADLFGKNQARAAEAAALLESEEAHRQGVMVSLLAEVARTYFDLRNDEAQIAITEKNLQTQQRTLDLITAQEQGALASNLDVQRAAAQVSTTASQLPVLQAARALALHRLNVLMGTPPATGASWPAPGGPLKPLAPGILVAAPAKVLANRPDVRAAERSFAASLSASDAASRELYPTISLVSFFGVQGSSLFTATPWGLGASLVQPVLNFGRIQSGIDAADARQKQAFLRYQETVLEALEDMENALSLYLHENARQQALRAAAEQNQKAVALADRQYLSGYSGLLDLLVAQRNALDAESSLASSDAQLRKTLVLIYAAAGGGWKL